MGNASEGSGGARYDRALLLHGPKRNTVLTLAEVRQYGADSSRNRPLGAPSTRMWKRIAKLRRRAARKHAEVSHARVRSCARRGIAV